MPSEAPLAREGVASFEHFWQHVSTAAVKITAIIGRPIETTYSTTYSTNYSTTLFNKWKPYGNCPGIRRSEKTLSLSLSFLLSAARRFSGLSYDFQLLNKFVE